MSIDILVALIIFFPLFVGIFTLTAQNRTENKKTSNAAEVALFGVFTNILFIVTLFSFANNTEKYPLIWSCLFLPSLELVFQADTLSLLFVLGSQVAVFVGILAIRKNTPHQKTLLFYTLFYLTFLNGYFFARDVLSFNIFYTAQIFPLFMMIGNVLLKQQYRNLARLSSHYFLGSILLFASCIFAIYGAGHSVLLSKINEHYTSSHMATLIWSGFFLAFILRLPLWPFHHATTSVFENLKNPLAFIALHILPLSSIYGFMRCWPLNIPFEISVLAPFFQGLCVLTMILVSFGGYTSINPSRKLSNYIIVYDLLYLLAVFLPTDVIEFNLGYSAFSFLLLTSCLAVLQAHMTYESARAAVPVKGVLCAMPHTSVCYGVFVLAAIGLPVSAFFWNNFLIVSEIFDFHLYFGTIVVLCMTLSAVSLLEGQYTLRDESCALSKEIKINDIDMLTFLVCLSLMLVLFVSLIKPLWFVW